MIEALKLPLCPFCQQQTDWNLDDIDGWIASVSCSGCDMVGPMSEFKYDDPEEAKVDALARWHRGFPPAADAGEVREKGCQCADCGAPYGDPAWIEAVSAPDDWLKLDPTVTAILCISCMGKRAAALGLSGIPIVQFAGPFVLAAAISRLVASPRFRRRGCTHSRRRRSRSTLQPRERRIRVLRNLRVERAVSRISSGGRRATVRSLDARKGGAERLCAGNESARAGDDLGQQGFRRAAKHGEDVV